jgi:hypothetical protein
MFLAATDCQAGQRGKTHHMQATAPDRSAESIGVATQEADGTIVLQLRTPKGSGMVGDALVRYPPGDPNYQSIARHVGPIPRGGSVPVRPFGGQ